jgi:hypothetical protein
VADVGEKHKTLVNFIEKFADDPVLKYECIRRKLYMFIALVSSECCTVCVTGHLTVDLAH